MVNVIIQLSKYLLIILILLYTFQCFTVFKRRTEKKQKRVLRKQITLTYLLLIIGFLNIFMNTREVQVLIFLLVICVYIAVVQILYRVIYDKSSLLVVNNMCMLLSIGFLILTRLDMDQAIKQFQIAGIATILAFIIPVIVRKLQFLSKLRWFYAGLGILCLGVVLALAAVSGGAKLSISIGGITLQLSELVKITFVFFMASSLHQDTSFKNVAITTIIAAAHVGILVLSTDLGTALVFFIAYLVVIYVATKRPIYALVGLAGGSAASVVAYFLFNHVRQRVIAWQDPFSVYQSSGYQIVQALFGIGAGGWFGMGLGQGAPNTIPVASRDFVFAAICEEMGGVFAICLILICMSLFLMIVNIAMRIRNPFYKLVALGLGTEYAFQVFLTIGGTTKFIPMTGITLPLVSYGGSSVMSTIIMLAIIQGLYILREDEDEEFEKERQELEKEKQELARQEQAIIDAGIPDYLSEDKKW